MLYWLLYHCLTRYGTPDAGQFAAFLRFLVAYHSCRRKLRIIRVGVKHRRSLTSLLLLSSSSRTALSLASESSSKARSLRRSSSPRRCGQRIVRASALRWLSFTSSQLLSKPDPLRWALVWLFTRDYLFHWAFVWFCEGYSLRRGFTRIIRWLSFAPPQFLFKRDLLV